MDQIVDCRVFSAPNGGKHLVFVVRDTGKCVGELLVKNTDSRYLNTISQLFSRWTREHKGLLPTSIHNILNGTAARAR